MSANKNYTRGIQQYIYPIILSPSFKFQESESLKIGMRREVTGWFWFHLAQSDPYDLSLVYDTTTFVLHICMRKTDGMNHFDMKVVGDFNLIVI